MQVPVVAFDVGPLSGPRTGIGAAVAALHSELGATAGLELVPYLTSWRSRPAEGVRRLPLPAALAHRLWSRIDHPRVDRWLEPAEVIHGTNYVVPPSTLPRLVSVYDCWFLRHREQAHPDVVRAGDVLSRAVRRGAVVHASSHATADAMAELFPMAQVRTVHLAPIPLPEPTASCPIPELDGRDFIVSVATLERRKNVPRLVDAFGEIAAAHPDLRLVIAGGDGDDRGAVDDAIDRLHADAQARVMVTGYVDDDVRAWLLRHATALAYPSIDEGFGFPLLDAMQAGVPIVASNAGSIPEVAGAAAILVDPSDVDALAGALTAAISDDATRRELTAAAAAQLHRFSWGRTAAEMVELYRDLAGGAV